MRRLLAPARLVAGSRLALLPPPRARRRERVRPLLRRRLDGDARARRARGRAAARVARDALGAVSVSATTSSAPRSASTRCLEGDFLLRSGRRSSYYLDKYRFETLPELLGPLGERLAAAVREHEPDAVRLAGPALGAVALAASASLASGLPFVIVRDAAKEYGTANRLEGPSRRASSSACRGRRHLRRRARRGRGGAPGGRSRGAQRGLRGRSRGGRRGRARPASACACARSSGQESSLPAAKTAAKPHG